MTSNHELHPDEEARCLGTREDRGFALIAVLVLLFLLTAIVGPFLMSMGDVEKSALDESNRNDKSLGVAGTRDAFLARLGETQGSLDDTPDVDGLDEFESKLARPGDQSSEFLDGRHVYTLEVEDMQGRVHAPSAPMQVWANLTGLYCYLSADLEKDEEEEIQVTSTANFPDQGYVWVGTELIRYESKSPSAFEQLTRGVNSAEGQTVADPYGPASKHRRDVIIVDPRVRNLVTWQFEQGVGHQQGPRNRFRPWSSVEELVRVGEAGYGELDQQDIEKMRPVLTFHAGRPMGTSFGKKERIFNALVAGETQVIVVRDGAAMPGGSIVRVEVGDQIDYALVLDTIRGQGRGTSIRLDYATRLVLDRPVQLDASEGEAMIRVLRPVPINLNTVSKETLALVMEGLRSHRQPNADSAFATQYLLYPAMTRNRAEELAEEIVLERGPTEEEDWEHPFESMEDVFKRLFEDQANGSVFSKPEAVALYRMFLNGPQAGFLQSHPAFTMESSGLVKYRVAGEVLAGIGKTLAETEKRGIAYAQPGRTVDRFATNQRILDDYSRLGRQSSYWTTGPMNSHMRITTIPGITPGEPADQSVAHLFPWFHGQEARFPTKKQGDGWFGPALMPGYNYGRNNSIQNFETSRYPEGRDLTKEDAPTIRSGLPGVGSHGSARGRLQGIPMMVPSDTGTNLGIGFGWGAWFKPRSLSEATLFELSNTTGDDFSNRTLLSLESDRIVLRVYDAAGQDPAPNETQPQETCIKWETPLSDTSIEANNWFHAKIEYQGHRPGMAFTAIDNVPKGKPYCLTWLTATLAEVDLSAQRSPDQIEKQQYPTISVESTEGFPPQGVLRIGDELIEYTSISGNSFNTAWVNSRGGRMLRQFWREFVKDDSGAPPGQQFKVTLPEHRAGSAVELYGYSTPVAENAIVTPGEGSLVSGTLARWGVARAVTAKDPIQVGPIPLGKGIDEKYLGKLDLTAPIAGAKKGSAKDLPGFEEGEGYALLIQEPIIWDYNPLGKPGQAQKEWVGGVELIKYSNFDGSSITINQRFLELGPDRGKMGKTNWFNGANASSNGGGKFVTEWNKGLLPNGDDPNTYPQMFLWVVPCSIHVGGLKLFDPADRGYSEWLQIYPKGHDDFTEWVRYDHAVGGHALRVRLRAMNRLLQALTRQSGRRTRTSNGGGFNNIRSGAITFPNPPTGGLKGIGYPDSKEDGPSYAARRAFRFRGDPSTGTTSHDQGSGSIVTPVHRVALRERDYTLGRLGRLDRVALLTRAGSSNAKEWHTVQWSHLLLSQWRPKDFDDNANGLQDPVGPQGTLVGLREGTSIPMVGQRLRGSDTRNYDRFVKFPSGEMPMFLADRARVGESVSNTPSKFQGMVDDIQGYFGFRSNPLSDGSDRSILGRLAAPISENDRTLQMTVGSNSQVRVTIQLGNKGAKINVGGGGNLRGGGLLWCEGELMGFKSVDRQSGRVELAQNGRGMLGTVARPHDVSARVVFVESMPATFTTGQTSASGDIFMVQDARRLPRSWGAALVDQEMIHYSYTSGNQLLQMPRIENPDAVAQGQGIFRGRFGTTPAAHAADTMVIAWPMRYLDRYQDRCDDPELARFQFSVEAPDLYVTQLAWEEEIPDALLDVVCLVRADERVPFSAEPDGKNGLWIFTDPGDGQGGLGRWVGYQASRWDFRFEARYAPGSFDAVNFMAGAWKKTVRVKNFGYSYESRTRILEEQETLK